MALIDRIKYDAPSDDAIVWKYPTEKISLGTQLIVNESQEAVFFKGGKALDTFGAGTHTLTSGNLPLLNKLINLPFGGRTPFSAEVWFINKTVKRDLKWGTAGPIQVIDPIYNYPISVRAFGSWGMRIDDVRSFLVQIIGTQSITFGKEYIAAEKIEKYFISEIIQRLSDALAKFFIEKKISIFQASAQINDLSRFLADDITPEFQRFGIEIVNFNIERISIPDEEKNKFQDILGKRMEIEQLSTAQVGQGYTAMRTFDTLEKIAENGNGNAGQLLGAGLGLGLGVGAGAPIGQQMSSMLDVKNNQPLEDDPLIKLNKLKQLLENDLINQDDFDKKKQQILDSL